MKIEIVDTDAGQDVIITPESLEDNLLFGKLTPPYNHVTVGETLDGKIIICLER